MSDRSEGGTQRRPYIQVQTSRWWLRNAFYRRYMLREATSVLVLLYSLNLLLGLYCLLLGKDAWEHWRLTMQQPFFTVCHLLALLAALYHAHTFFQLFPKVIELRIGPRKLPDGVLIAGQWLGFLMCSAVMLWIALAVGVAA